MDSGIFLCLDQRFLNKIELLQRCDLCQLKQIPNFSALISVLGTGQNRTRASLRAEI